jgi:hypothetical protein
LSTKSHEYEKAMNTMILIAAFAALALMIWFFWFYEVDK